MPKSITRKITFEIAGSPSGKGRHRTTKGGIRYTPKETVQYENLVKYACYEVMNGEPPIQGKVTLNITAYYQIPASTSKKKADLMREATIRPTTKPDLDNIMKITCDALNGIAYRDDAQIVSAQLDKFYSDRPRVCVGISGSKRED